MTHCQRVSFETPDTDRDHWDCLAVLFIIVVSPILGAPAESSTGGQGRGDRLASLVLLAAFGGAQQSRLSTEQSSGQLKSEIFKAE